MRALLWLSVVWTCYCKTSGGYSDGRLVQYSAINCRAHQVSIVDFGGVGDGKTLNTKSFQDAINSLGQYSTDGGGLLLVPPGRWLTGSFNLTSHFTLFLQNDAVLLASQDISSWPVVDPLPSYGHGRDTPGGRYASLIFGINLTDVIITGHNGTIDGQGSLWWQRFHAGKLKYTRPYLVEVMYSDSVQISNVTFLNSPTWHIHPVYSTNVIVKSVTISAPVTSPNTDGINPDSCSGVRIEDCHVISGDDCVAIKSGWDEYGIAFGMPSREISIRRLTCVSPYSAVIALGSEMSGGIEDVRVEDVTAVGTESGVRLKTAVGRGGFVKNVHVRGFVMRTMKWAFLMDGNYDSHADKGYSPMATPLVKGINYMDIVAEDVSMAGRLRGIVGDPFTGICMSNATIGLSAKPKKVQWNCADVEGVSTGVSPPPCDLLVNPVTDALASCHFPSDTLPVDQIQFQQCKLDT